MARGRARTGPGSTSGATSVSGGLTDGVHCDHSQLSDVYVFGRFSSPQLVTGNEIPGHCWAREEKMESPRGGRSDACFR